MTVSGFLTLQSVCKDYHGTRIVKNISLSVNQGEFVVFVGPSGCGKSTLLRLIAGLETLSSGTLSIDGLVMNTVEPSRRGVAMVFQSYALYPHMTVRQNMEFNLRIAKLPARDIAERISDVARILRLEPYLNCKPATLSGGQRQRVAIGRALVRKPKLFLFDEPLSNLDAELRNHMRIELATLHRKLGATTLYVTHDQVEAMTLADRIVVLRDGGIEQVGTPLELYQKPRTRFVAGFIGSPAMNFIPFTVQKTDQSATYLTLADTASFKTPPHPLLQDGQTGTLGIRAEDIRMAAPQDAMFHSTVMLVEHLGATTLLYVRFLESITLAIQTTGTTPLQSGDCLSFSFPPARCHIFDQHGLTCRPDPHQ
ncbi:sn-glycerol-3-phosphate ABC transporter ATP-binding protein UgpC [Acetobacter persici]|uniref:ABC transporter ATP-binding protein n=1 Tax=Acetobacter persici TaxID=1076596 RepID=UPI001BA8D1F3|nr:sn-glycerol-3-phosphate ABC transporter ATP-binding protein UgpC [Acetobacter persici]MBS1002031.1 sn-glycerol-3-phosphate ABC transporter ATP-binding protein UgpC [Acetobacter persici]